MPEDTQPRTIAEAVRAMDADGLARLITARPDLGYPVPHDLSELIERATTPTSTRLAVDALDAWQARVLTALAAAGDGIPMRRLAALLENGLPAVEQAVRELRRRALCWGPDGDLHVTRAVHTTLGPFPAGLAAASAAPLTDEQIDERLRQAGPEVRALLDRLVWGPPTGRLRDADRRGTDGDGPAPDVALGLKLLRAVDAETVILPREVALRLRGGRFFADWVEPSVPAWEPPADSGAADRAGLGSAFETLRHLESLLDEIGSRQPRPLSDGGFAKRDLAVLAAGVGNADLTHLLIPLAVRMGLLAPAGVTAWLPSVRYDGWVARPDWERFADLRDAWRDLDEWPSDGRPATGGSAQAAALRRAVWAHLVSAPAGTPVTGEALRRRIGWQRPTWPEPLLAHCDEVVTELTSLGLVALGRRTALVDADADPGFPEPATSFTVQADLTIVSFGPLRRDLAERLALLADRDPGSFVWRVGADGVLRALDAGWAAGEMHAWLAEHASTGVPQALTFLIDDVARKHGQVQVMAASTVVTFDNPAHLAQALVAASEIDLRPIGPGVAVSHAEPDEIAGYLRSLGLAPAARTADGLAVAPVAPRRSRPPVVQAVSAPERAEARALADTLLRRADPQRQARSAADIMTALDAAVGSDQWLEIDHVGDDGTPGSSTVRVLALASGRVRVQHRGGPAATIAVSRVIGVRRHSRLDRG